MTGSMPLYQEIYHCITDKIFSGIYKNGDRFPSLAALRKEYGASDTTIRQVVKMLSENNLIVTQRRRVPTVTYTTAYPHPCTPASQMTRCRTKTLAVVRTVELLYPPLVVFGAQFCNDELCDELTQLVKQLTLEERDFSAFWHCTDLFWRKVIAASGNAFIIRTVRELGFADIPLCTSHFAERQAYQQKLYATITQIREGKLTAENLQSTDIHALSARYTKELGVPPVPLSPGRNTADPAPKSLLQRGELYKCIYMDLIDQILVGAYQKGDYLPSGAALCAKYSVSSITARRAIQELSIRGFVKSVKGKGMLLTATASQIRESQMLDMEPVYQRLRRFFDSLQMLVLTCKTVTGSAAHCITYEEACRFYEALLMRQEENQSLVIHTPMLLLDEITSHITLAPLVQIYAAIEEHFLLGRYLSGYTEKETLQLIYQQLHRQCLRAINALKKGNREQFAEHVCGVYTFIFEHAAACCKKAGLWEGIQKVYHSKKLLL